MITLGIRQAKARLSELVRNAAKGECSLVTDNRKPVAMIGPAPAHSQEAALLEEDDEADIPPSPVARESKLSDATAFRDALFGAPFPLDVDF